MLNKYTIFYKKILRIFLLKKYTNYAYMNCLTKIPRESHRYITSLNSIVLSNVKSF